MGFADRFKSALRTLHSGGAFGEPVTYRPKAGGSFSIQGVFAAPYEQVDPEGIEVSSTKPILSVRNAELDALGVTLLQEDQVDVRGQAYWVADVMPDGEGATRLHLHEVSA